MKWGFVLFCIKKNYIVLSVFKNRTFFVSLELCLGHNEDSIYRGHQEDHYQKSDSLANSPPPLKLMKPICWFLSSTLVQIPQLMTHSPIFNEELVLTR